MQDLDGKLEISKVEIFLNSICGVNVQANSCDLKKQILTYFQHACNNSEVISIDFCLTSVSKHQKQAK